MGNISYDGTVVEFEDRLLAHLQIVIVQKFRAGEAFLMSWLDPISIGDGRSALWLTPGSRAPTIDRQWLDLLTRSASSGPGLIVMDEHGDLARAINQHELGRYR
jgi:hypothetical protein